MALRVSSLNGVGLAMCSMTSDCKQQNMSQVIVRLSNDVNVAIALHVLWQDKVQSRSPIPQGEFHATIVHTAAHHSASPIPDATSRAALNELSNEHTGSGDVHSDP